MTSARPGHARVAFDEHLWSEDLQRATPESAQAAGRARRELERAGAPIDQLRPCEDHGRDGTRLAGCLKLYVPLPAGPWGIVFQLARDNTAPCSPCWPSACAIPPRRGCPASTSSPTSACTARLEVAHPQDLIAISELVLAPLQLLEPSCTRPSRARPGKQPIRGLNTTRALHSGDRDALRPIYGLDTTRPSFRRGSDALCG